MLNTSKDFPRRPVCVSGVSACACQFSLVKKKHRSLFLFLFGTFHTHPVGDMRRMLKFLYMWSGLWLCVKKQVDNFDHFRWRSVFDACLEASV